MKKILIISLLCPMILFGQEENKTSQNDDLIRSMMRLTTQELYDTAKYYYNKNSFDTAVIGYNLLISKIPQNADIEQQRKMDYAYHALGYLQYIASDYRKAYDFYIQRLLICEKYNFTNSLVVTYLDMGAVYANLNQHDIADQYYLKSLELCKDSSIIILILSNMGANNLLRNKIDSSFYYFDKALKISNKKNEKHLNSLLNNIGSYYQLSNNYDSAFYFFRRSLEVSRNKKDYRVVAGNLLDIGKLFFELNNIDSAIHYINLSNKIAYENKFLNIIANNYLALSEIEKSKGKYKNALEYYETYNNLKDSIYNAGVYSSINLFQRQYEVSKTNQQIEELEIDRQLKENTIHYQKIILRIIFIVSLLMGFVLFIIIVQNKRLRKSYNVLVDKNVEIVELYKKVPEIIPENTQQTEESKQQAENKDETNLAEDQNTDLKNADENDQTSSTENEKYKNIVMSEQAQNELLNRILTFMKNTSEICDPEFTMDKLADSIQSNHLYVSYIINYVLKMNFCSFLNGYRIREAQRLFFNPDTSKYTVEFVANMVGYKSRRTFDEVFKKVTGVTPAFYIKSLKEKQNVVAID